MINKCSKIEQHGKNCIKKKESTAKMYYLRDHFIFLIRGMSCLFTWR